MENKNAVGMKGLSINMVPGLFSHPGDQKTLVEMSDEIESIKLILSHLRDHHRMISKALEESAELDDAPLDEAKDGTDLIYNWLQQRLTALSDQIQGFGGREGNNVG